MDCFIRPVTDAEKAAFIAKWQRLIWQSVRRVMRAHRARRYGDEDDYFQEGSIALLDAAQRFDPARNVKFITYATSWIFGRLRTVRDGNSGLIRYPAYWVKKLPNLPAVLQFLRDDRGRYCVPEVEVMTYVDRQEDVADLLKTLDEREREIIEKFYGFGIGHERMSLAEIAGPMHLTVRRVVGIKREAIGKLRLAVGA